MGVPNDADSGAGYAAPDHSECSGSDWRKHVLGEGGTIHNATHIYSQLWMQSPCWLMIVGGFIMLYYPIYWGYIGDILGIYRLSYCKPILSF